MAAESPSRGPEPGLPGEAAPDPPPSGDGAPADEMEELRHLILGPEYTAIDTVRSRLDALEEEGEQTRRVSRVLPEAIAHRAAEDGRLAVALEPTIEQTLKRSVERNPGPLVDALFPVIGPAIRRGIREALAQFMASINQTLEHSLSPRSLRWRLEAWRTKQSFAEIVLRNTLLYRVEQLLFIDREAGLPLVHVHADAVEVQDSALVSGMMTAIQDFVNDSFGAPDGSLETLQVGDLTVWIEPGPKAVLAAVVRGHPGPALREALHDLNESLHLRFRNELASFDGDTAPFAPAEPMLERGLLQQYREGEDRQTHSPLFWAVLALVLILGAVWLALTLRDRSRWEAYLDHLDAEPGLVVIEDGWDGGRRYIRGLRDPLAAAPAALLPNAGIDAADVDTAWEPYQSLDSAIVVRRAAQLLDAPPSVGFRVVDGALVASGSADAAWQRSARARAPLLIGVMRYDDSALTGARLQSLADSLARQSVRFQVGTPRLLPDQEAALDRLAALTREILEASSEAGRDVRIRVAGHASREGSEAFNETLSQQRAETTVRLLTDRGLPARAFEAVGTGQPRSTRAETDEAGRAFNRSTAFQVTTSDPH